jgi:hypothetical protein
MNSQGSEGKNQKQEQNYHLRKIIWELATYKPKKDQ